MAMLANRYVLALTLGGTMMAPPALAQDFGDACGSSFNSGQIARKQGRLREARDLFARCREQSCPAQLRERCGSRFAEVDAAIPTVVVRATDARGNDLTDVEVTVSGRVVTSRLDGRSFAMDPGPQVLRISTKGARPIEQSILLVAGEKNRIVVVKFPELGAAVLTDGIVPPTKPAPSISELQIPILTWVFAGVAGASLATFAGLSIKGYMDESSLRKTCSPNCSASDVSGVRTKYIIADVSLGLGLASAGLATYFFFARSSGEKSASSRALQLDLSPRVEGGAYAGVSGRF